MRLPDADHRRYLLWVVLQNVSPSAVIFQTLGFGGMEACWLRKVSGRVTHHCHA